jgi:hypothetical protein
VSTTQVIALRKRGNQVKRGYPVAAATKILQHQLLDISTGYARPWPSVAALGLIPGGYAIESQDNTLGSAGDLWVEAECGEHLLPINDFTTSKPGDLAFGTNEETASSSNASGTLAPIGRVTEVVLAADPRVIMGEVSGVWVDVGDASIKRTPISIVKTITHADLTAAATTESESLGGVLPTGAKLRSVSMTLNTDFSGGGVGSATMQLGIVGGDTDAVRTAEDVFTTAANIPITGTAGVLGYAGADLGGQQLGALFTVDTTTAALTAGSVTITIVVDFPGA